MFAGHTENFKIEHAYTTTDLYHYHWDYPSTKPEINATNRTTDEWSYFAKHDGRTAVPPFTNMV